MDIKDLTKKQIIHKDGAFMPLVFVDMALPAAYVGVAAMAAKPQVNSKIDQKKREWIEGVELEVSYAGFCSISNDREAKNSLLGSIDDIIIE